MKQELRRKHGRRGAIDAGPLIGADSAEVGRAFRMMSAT
jgi:hypothetical protein